MGTVEDVASLVAYLASEEAQFLTGQSVGSFLMPTRRTY